MTDRIKSTNVVSNEAVIDDLTKDLGTSLSVDEDANNFIINPETSTQAKPTEAGDAAGCSKPNEFTDIPLREDTDYDKDEKESNESSDCDSVDEEALKDAEVELTENQKAERQIIAEELKVAGNDAFKSGDYDRSIEKYTEGLKICPLHYSKQRSILYCNRSAAKMKLQKYKGAIKDCTKAIELDGQYIKAYLRRASSYESTQKLDESLNDYKKILELDPDHKEARIAVHRLPPLIEEKNEKLKQEMFGKLKDLGNMILKPFGLSTENFKLEQDPESKGYKVNFKQ